MGVMAAVATVKLTPDEVKADIRSKRNEVLRLFNSHRLHQVRRRWTASCVLRSRRQSKTRCHYTKFKKQALII